MTSLHSSSDAYIALIHTVYTEQLKVYPQPPQYTVLAALYLTTSDGTGPHKIISLGTGTKCLPECRLTLQGEALHDSHAEVLARRGAVRWFLEEILRERVQGSQWIETYSYDSKSYYRLKDGVHIEMYISTVPCGDASTRFLAAFQDPEMAALKDGPASASAIVAQPEGTILSTSRGRNNYHLFNVLRTKPGRADSPPTLSLSCSDKIASWAWLGILGALGARFFGPGGVYLRRIIIGEVHLATTNDIDLRDAIREDCVRALGGRLEGLLPNANFSTPGFTLHKPIIEFTSIPFVHSRLAIGMDERSVSSNDSLCWRADSFPPSPLPVLSTVNTKAGSGAGTVQVLINGYKRGASPKHRQRLNDDKFLPHLCKLSIFRLYARLCKEINGEVIPSTQSYYDVKTSAPSLPPSVSPANPITGRPRTPCPYHEAKICLKGPSGPFRAWWEPEQGHLRDQDQYDNLRGADRALWIREDIGRAKKQRRGQRWEGFNVDGELVRSPSY
ncbi:hypothetical protein BT96DRAFT_418164 [Gymnopus androsaceus JB14]|uniref:A to I editase domain-containing protein n=1 Tax=Gymnopus androsaceus JB14 TaxID=1447944 RepID=A0A6A4I129_9AGAR|nr:hypothetical protein BT96DRAFT_418164 [Gymnopus androsaceus JB14]